MDLDTPRPWTARRPARPARAATLAVAALALAGCGIRVETPPPPVPVPGPVEVVRQAAAEASAELARDAAAASEATVDEPLFAALEHVRLGSEEHVEALGGVYSEAEGGVIDPATSDGVEGSVDADAGDDDEAPPAPVDPTALVLDLVEQAAAARAAADRVDDAPLAQLLAVVATSRLLAADALARRLDADRPELGGAGLPTVLPQGLGTADLERLVLAEDQAAFAFETIAARSPEGGVRTRALAAATRHRATSEAWARLAGLAEPGLDPRAVSYALDGAADTAESRKVLGADVEQALVVSYAALVALADPGSRAELAELHTLATESARRWGLGPTALPGLG